ncbi:hypothetical protein D3C81_1837320 [compost metagenome]
MIAQIPSHGLAGLQFAQVAIGIETGGQFGFGRRAAVAFGQAAVAVSGAGQSAAMGLGTDVRQDQQVTPGIVVIRLAVIGNLVGVEC